MTARKTSLQIARLRAHGCKVHTVIGHWAEKGAYHYGVVLPDAIVRADVAPMSTPRASVYVDRWSSNRILVQTDRPANMLGLNEEVAGVLGAIADKIEEVAAKSSTAKPAISPEDEAAIREACDAAGLASHGDSNDDEIDALQNLVDVVLGVLGFPRPDTLFCWECEEDGNGPTVATESDDNGPLCEGCHGRRVEDGLL